MAGPLRVWDRSAFSPFAATRNEFGGGNHTSLHSCHGWQKGGRGNGRLNNARRWRLSFLLQLLMTWPLALLKMSSSLSKSFFFPAAEKMRTKAQSTEHNTSSALPLQMSSPWLGSLCIVFGGGKKKKKHVHIPVKFPKATFPVSGLWTGGKRGRGPGPPRGSLQLPHMMASHLWFHIHEGERDGLPVREPLQTWGKATAHKKNQDSYSLFISLNIFTHLFVFVCCYLP